MKIIVFGAEGQLGKAFVEKLRPICELYHYDKAEFDIIDYVHLTKTIQDIKPELIINCAAFTDTVKCESDVYSNYMVNAFVPFVLADTCTRIGCKLVHFSTDYVFGGNKNIPYTEKDETNPLNEYGKAKLISEKFVLKRAPNSLVFRLSWVYGMGNSNFICKLISWSRANKILRISDNEISVPSSVEFIVKYSLKALDLNLSGLYHLTPFAFCSRFEWANELKSLLKLQVDILPAKMEEFDQQINRPLFSAMSSELLANELNLELPHWKEILVDYITHHEEYFK